MSEQNPVTAATDAEIEGMWIDMSHSTGKTIKSLWLRIDEDRAKIVALEAKIASLSPLERLHEAEYAVVRFVLAEMALSLYLDGEERHEGVEADLAEEETEAIDAIRTLGRKIAGIVEPGAEGR